MGISSQGGRGDKQIYEMGPDKDDIVLRTH
jgi:hypothetical protein